MNNKNKNKTTTLKTLLMLSITSMMLIPGGIIPVYAAPGSLLLTINNPTPVNDDIFGRSVAVAYNDKILIGATYDSIESSQTGSAYLFNSTDGTLLLTINNPTPVSGENFASSVAITPDGNLLIGAFNDFGSGSYSGSAYLFNGTDGSLLLTLNHPAPSTTARFGFSVASTPDGNLLIGASNDNIGASYTGSAYLFNGTDGSLLLTITNPTPEAYDTFGVSVATTINGDLLVGAHQDKTNASNAGSAYLFDGDTGNLLLTINNPTPEDQDFFGIIVATTINGNLLVGTGTDNTNADDAGSVYLFNGTDGSLLLTINNPTPEVDDYFGLSVAGTSNGNILVGAVYDDTDDTDAGYAYLFNGTDGSLLLTITNPMPEQFDYFGYTIVGTINGNILVSATGDDTGASAAGSVYLFEGISTPAPTITSLVADDSDDLDDVYSINDTLTITFDSDTNEPGGTGIQNRIAVDDL